MGRIIDYYYALASPWTYLGGPRLDRIAADARVRIDFKPVNLGEVFPDSGGLPLAKRAPQR